MRQKGTWEDHSFQAWEEGWVDRNHILEGRWKSLESERRGWWISFDPSNLRFLWIIPCKYEVNRQKRKLGMQVRSSWTKYLDLRISAYNWLIKLLTTLESPTKMRLLRHEMSHRNQGDAICIVIFTYCIIKLPKVSGWKHLVIYLDSF